MDGKIEGIEKKFVDLTGMRKKMTGYLEIGEKLIKKIEYIYSSISKTPTTIF